MATWNMQSTEVQSFVQNVLYKLIIQQSDRIEVNSSVEDRFATDISQHMKFALQAGVDLGKLDASLPSGSTFSLEQLADDQNSTSQINVLTSTSQMELRHDDRTTSNLPLSPSNDLPDGSPHTDVENEQSESNVDKTDLASEGGYEPLAQQRDELVVKDDGNLRVLVCTT